MKRMKRIFVVLMLSMVLVCSVSAAFANSSGSSGDTFGWEGTIESFSNALRGKTARNICAAAIIICALALVFNPDMQAWMKTLVAIVLVAACCAAAPSIIDKIFSTACMI